MGIVGMRQRRRPTTRREKMRARTGGRPEQEARARLGMVAFNVVWRHTEGGEEGGEEGGGDGGEEVKLRGMT